MDETRLDKIEIKELEVFANHGVFPEETALGQKFCCFCCYVYRDTSGQGWQMIFLLPSIMGKSVI